MGNKAGAATLEHSHNNLPATKGMRAWFKKTFTKGMESDVPLIAYSLFLLGCAVFSLAQAYQGDKAIL